MNKLIIVGNGFDVHCGLPSRYSDFIKWLILSSINIENNVKYFSNNLIEITSERISFGHNLPKFTTLEELVKHLFDNKFSFKDSETFDFIIGEMMFQLKFEIKSDLVEQLLKHQIEKNWVDIEMIYYRNLKILLSRLNNTNLRPVFNEDDLVRINQDLNYLKSYLGTYLKQVVGDVIVPYNFNYCAEAGIDPKIIIDKFHVEKLSDDGFENENKKSVKFKNITFLNFNYTGLPYQLQRGHYKHIDIHGSLFQHNNIPVFGFGDEIDSDYLEMEKTNNNDFLTHIKSFAYFNNTNYKDLIDFIDSDSYVVYIWGHSCGLSDRTLLNMIFEHDNCAAIKPYYWERGKGVDNYTEITQNISRHFKNKLKMRNRVINKQGCYPLGSQD